MMFTFIFTLVLGLCSVKLFGMDDYQGQLDLCPKRRETYYQPIPNENKKKICPFCDPEILKTNYIIHEDANIREMMNKHPYPPFDQALHLLIMPIVHKE